MAAALLAASGPGAAQTNVSIYGLLDASVRVVDDASGGRLVTQGSGDQQGPRIGIRGSEDLGAGMGALFLLESGISLNNGAFSQGGLAFGRQAYAGLATRAGTVTAGRQYDFMVELGAYHAVQAGTGTLDWNLGDLDRVAGERLDGSIKYTYAGGPFYGGILYARDNAAPGAPSTAGSAMFRYAAGGLSVGAAATQIRGASVAPFAAMGVPGFLGLATTTTAGAPVVFKLDRSTNTGVGGSYRLGSATLLALYTRTRLSRGAEAELLRTGHIALRYELTPQTVLAAGVTRSLFNDASWRREAVSIDHFLSTRTDLYLSAILERAAGAGVRAVLFTVTPSSGARQAAIVAGVRHRF